MIRELGYNKITIAFLLLATSSAAMAHGYIKSPASRGYLCNQGSNSDCGQAQWEPQSLEGPDGFPNAGVADGEFGSVGLDAYAPLDQQTSDRWTKTEVTPGPLSITWWFTASHVSKNLTYYLTKPDWNPNKPLTREAFDLTPFCFVNGEMQRPPTNEDVIHSCTLPERTGHQVIMALWDVGDTENTFYNLLDVNFKDSSTALPNWDQGGNIYPSVDLLKDDRVIARVFDKQGERHDLQVSLTITDNQQGQRNQWTHALATKINHTHEQIKAGHRTAEGNFNPVYGHNPIYLKEGSGLLRVEIQIEQQEGNTSDEVTVSGLADEYPIVAGQTKVDFSIAVEGDFKVTNTLYNHAGTALSNTNASLSDTSKTFEMTVDNAVPGHHQLVVTAIPNAKGKTIQQTFDMMFISESTGGEHEYIFPEGLNNYTNGTRVLQPKTGKVYECKPYPYSGYCAQWSSNATQYEPGVGSDWQSAWLELP